MFFICSSCQSSDHEGGGKELCAKAVMLNQTAAVQCHTKLASHSDLFMEVFPCRVPHPGNIFSCAETKNNMLSLGELVKWMSNDLSEIPLYVLDRTEAASPNRAFKIQTTQQEALTEDML